MDKIIKLVSGNQRVSFSKDFKAEMGYMTHLVDLGKLIFDLKERNEAVKECLSDNPDWEQFFTSSLKPQIEHRKGPLFDDPRLPKADPEEQNFFSRLVGNFKLQKPRNKQVVETEDDENNVKLNLNFEPDIKGNYEDDGSFTKQEDMDRLIQPYLSFEDDGEEVIERYEVNEIEKSPEYDINKYSSNDVRQKPNNFILGDDDEEEKDGVSVMQRLEQKERNRAMKNRYGEFGMVAKTKKQKPEVLGVTGVDYDSPHE